MEPINRRLLLQSGAAAGAAAGLAALTSSGTPARAAGGAPSAGEFGSASVAKSSPLWGTEQWPWDSYGNWGEQRCVPRDSSKLFGTYDYRQAYESATALGTINMIQRYDKAEPDRIHNNAVHEGIPQLLSTKAILEQSFKGSAYCNKYSAKAQGTWIVDIEMPDIPGIYVCALLWPTNNNTPGAEIDFLEGVTSTEWTTHLHWQKSDGSIADQVAEFNDIKTAGKHRYRLDVWDGGLAVAQDGHVVAEMQSSHVPSWVPMNLCVQTCFDYEYYGVDGRAGIDWGAVADGPWDYPGQSRYVFNSGAYNRFALDTMIKVTPIQIPW